MSDSNLSSFFQNNGGSIGSAVVTGLFNADQARRTRQFNAEQASISRDWQEQMWNKQNAYNSPFNQMKLMKDAGLNVNAMYGQGTASAAATSAGSPATANGGSPASMSAPQILGMAQIHSMEANAKLAESQANKTDKEADWMDSINQTNLENVQALTKKYMADENLSWAEASKMAVEVDKLRQDIEESIKRCDNLVKEGKKLDLENENYQRIVDAQIKDYLASANLKGAQAVYFKQAANEIAKTLQLRLTSLGKDIDLKTQQFDFNELLNPKVLKQMGIENVQGLQQIFNGIVQTLTMNYQHATSVVPSVIRAI